MISTALTAIQDWWNTWGSAIMAVAGAMWETVKAIFAAAFEIVESLFLAFVAIINGDWEELGEQITDIWQAAWNMVKTIFSAWWSVVKVWLGDVVEGIKKFFGEAFDWLVTKAQTILDNIKTFFSLDTWISVGNGLIDGIKQGVNNAAQGLIDAVVGAAQKALQTVKDFLGIHSPSAKAAAQIGLPFAQGIQEGIMDGIGAIKGMDLSGMLGNVMVNAQPRAGQDSVRNNIVKYFTMNVNTVSQRENITGDFRFLEAIG